MNIDIEREINLFLKKSSHKGKVIVVYGPTACGKSQLGIEIAKLLNSEIISTDSRQVFKYLNIGTGKVTFDEMQGIKHHMIDIITPDVNYSVGEFKKQSEEIISKLQDNGKIPVLVGGTGLYIDSLIYDFNIPEVPPNIELRKKLKEESEIYGKEYVYEKLKKIDEEYALELNPNNLNYVIRAIEVKMMTGKSKRDYRGKKIFKYDTLLITPYDGDREKLYKTINLRVQKMFDNGFVDEVRGILNRGYKKTDFGMKTIGYREVIEYLEGKISLEECMEKTKQLHRNYAKRQLTWFSKYNLLGKSEIKEKLLNF